MVFYSVLSNEATNPTLLNYSCVSSGHRLENVVIKNFSYVPIRVKVQIFLVVFNGIKKYKEPNFLLLLCYIPSCQLSSTLPLFKSHHCFAKEKLPVFLSLG